MPATIQPFTNQPIFAALTTKQRAILAAAIDVFAEKGYANSSTHEIAKRAGVAEGNIFRKFGSKAGLLQAIIDPVVENIFPTTMDRLAAAQLQKPAATLTGFITALVMARVKFFASNAAVVKVFLGEVIYSNDIRQRLLANLPERYWRAVHSELEHLRTTNQIVAWSDQAILRLIWSLVGGTLVGTLYFNQPLADGDVQRLITALIKALTPSKEA
jgi:AcrR family transcriptional regulator